MLRDARATKSRAEQSATQNASAILAVATEGKKVNRSNINPPDQQTELPPPAGVSISEATPPRRSARTAGANRFETPTVTSSPTCPRSKAVIWSATRIPTPSSHVRTRFLFGAHADRNT